MIFWVILNICSTPTSVIGIVRTSRAIWVILGYTFSYNFQYFKILILSSNIRLKLYFWTLFNSLVNMVEGGLATLRYLWNGWINIFCEIDLYKRLVFNFFIIGLLIVVKLGLIYVVLFLSLIRQIIISQLFCKIKNYGQIIE